MSDLRRSVALSPPLSFLQREQQMRKGGQRERRDGEVLKRVGSVTGTVIVQFEYWHPHSHERAII